MPTTDNQTDWISYSHKDDLRVYYYNDNNLNETLTGTHTITVTEQTKKEILSRMQSEINAISKTLVTIAYLLLPIAIGTVIAIYLAVTK